MLTESAWIRPDWPMSDKIVAGASTRFGGNSTAPALAENNVGLNVGDVPSVVQGNRQALARMIAGQNGSLQSIKCQSPLWCNGWIRCTAAIVSMLASHLGSHRCTSGRRCVDRSTGACPSHSKCRLRACRDDDSQGPGLAQPMAGGVGLVAGVCLNWWAACPPRQVICMRGWAHALARTHFEVGAEVWRPIERICAEAVDPHPSDSGKRLVDLPLLTQYQLYACGVEAVSQSGLCSYTGEAFYSHRQATHERGPGAQTGRMATFIFRMA